MPCLIIIDESIAEMSTSCGMWARQPFTRVLAEWDSGTDQVWVVGCHGAQGGPYDISLDFLMPTFESSVSLSWCRRCAHNVPSCGTCAHPPFRILCKALGPSPGPDVSIVYLRTAVWRAGPPIVADNHKCCLCNLIKDEGCCYCMVELWIVHPHALAVLQ